MQVLIVAGTSGRSTCFFPMCSASFLADRKWKIEWKASPITEANSTDENALELLHRAVIQGDQEAWEWMLHCFSGLVLGWLHRHPNRSVACRLEREDMYVAQAFARFRQVT